MRPPTTSGRSSPRRERRPPTSSSSAPRSHSWPASPMRWPRPVSAASDPSAAAARLEGSKAFAKEAMAAAGVPTAAAREVDSVADGLAAVTGYPTVLKADGLAAGKGVVIAADEDEARAALEDMLVQRRFGETSVLVEELLEGEELSLLALCDGERALPMAPAQDYKRIFDGDEGPNTGGMGSYSPVPGIDGTWWPRSRPTSPARGRPEAARGTPFHGVLYAGLMLTDAGRGAGVQRPLRRPGDAGRASPPAQRPARAAARGDRAGRPGRSSARVGRSRGGDARAGERGLSAIIVDGRRDHRPERCRPGRRADARGHGASRRRRS